MTSIQEFLADNYRTELTAFRAVLDTISEETFGTDRLGHSPAWHALHIADWLRLTVLGDRAANYHYLGWEDKDWAQAMGTEAAPMTEAGGKAAVLARLEAVGEQAVVYLRGASDTDMQGMTFSPSAPTGERPRLAAVGLHLRHVAYHRGQVVLGQKA
ncbi:DinB family protein [Deinococcus aerophilus]|uniref:DinB-like domain-containing protein n=1 Tax=Deinococcus aerophilus TaxID=522488 RepID=A0ABQ2GTE6_9DEIO|nr:DinB family protein [Deinococcus aerophilus]GGM11000.1 hypothetical protein GCM10010841_19360 [Deinococcus aerophilus]